MALRRIASLLICGSVVAGASVLRPAEPTFAVGSSFHLELVDELPGRIVDVTQDQILWVDYSVDPSQVTIKDRASGVQTVLGEGEVSNGFLVPGGAIYGRTRPGMQAHLIHYKNGSETDLGLMNSDYSLVVSGTWAIWNTDVDSPPGQTPLLARDVITDEQRIVSENAGNWQNDVAENGDIVFWDRQYNIVRDRGGQQEVLSTATDTEWATYPRTDGINVIYRRHSNCCGDNESGGIWLTTDQGELDLDAFRNEWPREDADYAVNDGWAAFTRATLEGGLTMWSRDPQGFIEPRSPGLDTQIGVLGQGGQMLMYERTSGIDRIFLSRTADELIDLGPLPHTAFWAVGTDWYVAAVEVAVDEYEQVGPVINHLYVVAPGAAPEPTASPSAPAPSDQSSPAVTVTVPPTDGPSPGNQHSGSSATFGLVLGLLGLVSVLLLAPRTRRGPRP